MFCHPEVTMRSQDLQREPTQYVLRPTDNCASVRLAMDIMAAIPPSSDC